MIEQAINEYNDNITPEIAEKFYKTWKPGDPVTQEMLDYAVSTITKRFNNRMAELDAITIKEQTNDRN
jgi:hypothetical protein